MGIKVGVIGAGGRMGSAVCDAVERDEELELVVRIGRGDELDELESAGSQVAVEFTTPDTVKANSLYCLERGIHVVVGATGLSDEDLKEIEAATGRANAFVAPNFAVGAVLMMRFAREAAPYFRSAEIVERHHERKLDAPSGTSLRTAALMNEARADPWDTISRDAIPAGAESRGTDAGGVRIHSLRLPGSVAHQEVVLGADGEILTIRHDSLDRSSFMPGVLLAIRNVGERDGLTVGLEHLL